MASPNIINASSITGKTALVNLTTASSNVLTNSSTSNTVNKLNNITLTNYSANTIGINVIINRSSTNYYLAGNISVPSNSALVLLAKDTQIYLEEGDVVQAFATANSAITFAASYELIA